MMTALAFNGILSVSPAESKKQQRRGDGPVMVLRWFSRLWDRGASRSDDPEFPGRTPSEAKRLREESRVRQESDQKTERDRKEHEHEIDFLLMQAAREAYRIRAQFAAELADMRMAIWRAHEQASVDEAAAREGLEDAKRRAVFLSDGRRVYFTADGSTLYDEDGYRITDARTITEARERHSPASTTREEFAERLKIYSEVRDKTKRLQDALQALDEIDVQLTGDGLDAERVRTLRDKARQVMETLPTEVRTAYDRMRADRMKPESTQQEASAESCSILASQFRNAVSRAAQAKGQSEAAPDAQRVIAYRAAPEF